MSSTRLLIWMLLLILAGCGNTFEDLIPSGRDKRPTIQQGTIGPAVGQNAPDFTLPDSLGNTFTLSATIPAYRGIVLYFTMWCPTCDSQMSNLESVIMPHFPGVLFVAVDYVSGSVIEARNAQIANGFANSGFTVLADTSQTALNLYQGTMGTTVVIDGSGVILMNEDYKDGIKLQSILVGLP